MGKLFGTDGIRGVVNAGLDADLAYKVGLAAAEVLAKGKQPGEKPLVTIGKDTRISGDLLKGSLISGLCTAGADVLDLGTLPTPGVAWVTVDEGADAGIVISASHNPFEHNGIKIFNGQGFKLSDGLEDEIEKLIKEGMDFELPTGENVGHVIIAKRAVQEYKEFLKSTARNRFDGLTVMLDCANGAASEIAYDVFTELGAKVVALSDSNGYIYDKNGIDLDAVKKIKEVERKRIKEYLNYHKDAEYHEGCKGIWTIKCDVALPCATQNEIDEESAKILVANGVTAVGEGANMPSTPEAIETFISSKVLFGPAKAANAGGVATSALEMSQNSMRYSWTFEEVDAKLKDIMVNIYKNASSAAKEYGHADNLVYGANIAGFLKVAESMLAHGVV